MPITLDQFNHLADQCAPGIDHRTLRPFAQVESQFDPWAVHDNASGQSYHPDTQAKAIAIARDLIRQGHVVDSGLMQVSSKNFQWLGLTVETAFDPCQSIRAAAQHLTDASRYNTGSPTRGFANGYVQKIVHATFNVDPAHPLDQAGGTVAGTNTSSTDTAIRLQREASGGATVEKASPAPSSPPIPSWDLFRRARSGAQSVLALNAQ